MYQRKDYINWDEYFMGIAFLSAKRSKDPNTQVGACIVSQDNKILSMGYNGFPNGCSDEKQYILNGLKMYEPELNITSLAFRLKGSNATLSNVNYDSAYSEESKRYEKKLREEEKILNNYSKNDEKNSSGNEGGTSNELPPDLLKIFENMEKKAQKDK